MTETLRHGGVQRGARQERSVDWCKRMSNHIAFALLVYTGLHIIVTMGAIKSQHGSILPYFGLVILVAAIIPGCRLFEKRWEAFAAGSASDAELRSTFFRDCGIVWLAAIGLPFLVTAMVKGILALA